MARWRHLKSNENPYQTQLNSHVHWQIVHNFAFIPIFFIFFHLFAQNQSVSRIRMVSLWENDRKISRETSCTCIFYANHFHVFNTYQSIRVCVCASELKVFRRICWWFEITLRTTFYLAVLLFIVVYNVNWPNVSHCFCDVLISTMTYNGIYYQNHCMINFDTFNQLISVHCALCNVHGLCMCARL